MPLQFINTAESQIGPEPESFPSRLGGPKPSAAPPGGVAGVCVCYPAFFFSSFPLAQQELDSELFGVQDALDGGHHSPPISSPEVEMTVTSRRVEKTMRHVEMLLLVPYDRP